MAIKLMSRTHYIQWELLCHSNQRVGLSVSVKGVRREEFFRIVPKAGIRTQTVTYPLIRANEALADLRSGRVQGAVVLVPWTRVTPSPREHSLIFAPAGRWRRCVST